jgi:ABC-type spermidine/putrescine transport system permease subunit II
MSTRIPAYYHRMTGSSRPGLAYEREETESERLDRNWNEILQELRVTQTGTQILTGFLLTVAFQNRFTDLDTVQVTLYLALVVGAIATTALGLAPVSLHRQLFRQRAKDDIVGLANRSLKATMIGIALVLSGTIALIFDVVVGRAAGMIVGAVTLVIVLVLWLVVPMLRRLNRKRNNTDNET